MASIWSGNGSGSTASSRLPLIIGAVVFLIAGLGGGYLLGSSRNDSPKQTASAIADSTVDGVFTASANQAGAVRAATSVIVGIPTLATSLVDQTDTIKKLTDNTAGSNATQNFTTVLASVKTGLATASPNSTARIITMPASYKVTVNSDGTLTVTVWYATVYADPSTSAFRSAWATSDVQLKYTDHWRIVKLTNTDGPIPDLFTSTATPGQYSAIQPVLNNSYAYRYALAP